MKQLVYEYLIAIPAGKVVTYGQIAAYLGNKHLSRAVGNILHQNPDGDRYPCYRVVNSKGQLSKHYAFGGIQAQQRRLQAEGIKVENNRVDLEKYQHK